MYSRTGLLATFAAVISPKNKMISSILLGFMNLGGGEIFIVLVIILLLFGAKRIPDLARGLGKGIKEFKDAKDGIEKDEEKKS